jgi:hypothetical protein
MHYTIFELERIEKILTAKLEEAKDAYAKAVHDFREKWSVEETNVPFENEEAVDVKFIKDLKDDLRCMLLKSEVDLFERGIHALYSYWNYSVEIFIDNMRTRTEEDYPERERFLNNKNEVKPVIDPNGEDEHEA